jgi:hypothetical protein
MTGLLKDLMSDKAEHVSAPRLDVDAIIEAGDKRVRRRRIVTGAGVAAAAAVTVAAIAIVPSIVDNSSPPPVDRPPAPTAPEFTQALATYAIGSEIFYGNRTLDVAPLQVSALTQTDAGFVLTTSDFKVYLADGHSTEQIGTAGRVDNLALVSDGPYAAWIDWSTETPELVVYNTVERKQVVATNEDTVTSRDESVQAAVLAMDGAQVYWHNSVGVVVQDVSADTGPIALMPGAFSDWLIDVEKGTLSFVSFDNQTTTVSREPTAESPNFQGFNGLLSDDAENVVVESGDQTLVYDVSNGNDVTPQHAAYPYLVFGQWLDSSTFTAFGQTDPTAQNPPFDLLVCSTTSEKCQVDSRDLTGDVVKPNGVPTIR